MKIQIKGGSGNLAGSRVTKKPGDLDPATAHAALEQAEEFGFRVRDLIDRGHKPRNAIEIALKNSGMYEILSRRPGAMERIFAYFEGEVTRLQTAMDDRKTIQVKRGVVVARGRVPKACSRPECKVIYGADGKVAARVG